MTNNEILTLLNPRIVKKDNELYFALLSCLGLQNNPSYCIFFKANEKVLSTYNGTEIFDMLSIIHGENINRTKIANTLYNGFSTYKLGEDYFISESLYEYLSQRTDKEEDLIKDKIYINDILEDSKDLILAIKNHDADLFNENFNFDLPENLSFIQRNISNTDIISLVIQKPYLLPDDSIEYEYLSIIDIFGLEQNGVYVIGYYDDSNVDFNDNISYITDNILNELNCIKEENGRYTIDLTKYIDYEKSNMSSITEDNSQYIFEDFIIDNKFNVNTVYYDIISNTSIDRYYMIQKALKRTFKLDELNNLSSTFFDIINEYTTISDFTYPNNIYKYVIDYYKNYGNDAGLNAINLILGSTYTTTVYNTSQYGCSCNSGSTGNCTSLSDASSLLNSITNGNISNAANGNVSDISTLTCADKYKAAMEQYLINMLSDINFYCDWMWTNEAENNDNDDSEQYVVGELVPNIELIDLLIKLLTEFLDLGYNLSASKSTTKCGCHTRNCSDISDYGNSSSNNSHCTNCNIIENYIKVLEWTKEGKLEENKNKIIVYGKQFAHLLPGLIF